MSDHGTNQFLSAQMLVAMPNIGDPRFARSVIFICAHSEDGAMGIIVNKPSSEITFSELIANLDIVPEVEQIKYTRARDDIEVHIGGPVETARGFVLHSADYFSDSATLPIDDMTGLTATIDVLRAIAKGEGPEHALLALGYAGWDSGQLESEIRANGWLHCDADQDLLFGVDPAAKYDAALAKIGIDPGHLAADAGHA